MHRFDRLSVCTDWPGCLYAQICQVVCMHRFARLSMYAQICQVVCMHRFASLSVCTDLPGCPYAQICHDNVISKPNPNNSRVGQK